MNSLIRQTVTCPAFAAAVLTALALAGCGGSAVSDALKQLSSKYTVGGSVSGLSGSGLVLEDNGGDDLPIGANGAFTFATALAVGAAYSVTVKTQPGAPAQTCSLTGASGAVGAANVTSVAVSCATNTYTIGGSVSGLIGSGLALADNGGDALAVSADGSFTFATPVASGAAYAVTVTAQPGNPSQTCTVANGSGMVGAANVANVAVACATTGAAVIVTPALDTAHAVTVVIPAASGGSITATGADGSVFTLSVPAKALLSDESITLTPLTGLGGLPISGGLLAGVDLGPAGLELQQAATLTIAPATTVPANQQVGFGYHAVAGQQEFHFHALALTSAISLAVTHFSGAGVGQGSPGNGGTPSSPADLLEAQIAQLINQERGCQLTGSGCDPNYQSELAQLFQDFYTQVVSPLVQQALTDDSVAQSAIEALTSWGQVVTLLVGSKPPFDTELQQIPSQIVAILTNAYGKAYGRCLNDSSQAQRTIEGNKMIEDQHNLVLLGAGSANFNTEIAACLTGPLTLDIDSQTTLIVGATTATFEQDHDSHVSAQKIQLTFDPARLAYTGSAPLTYVSYTFATVWPAPATDCSSGTGHDGTVTVVGEFDLNVPVLAGASPRVHLTLEPTVTETDVACIVVPNSPPASDPPIQDQAYVAALGYAHVPETPPGSTAEASPYYVTVNTAGAFNFADVVTPGAGATVTASESTTLTLVQSN
ncbi:MAG TPA: hypothetical protein VET46_08625 [Steroidobacteraceae bacterium]|nr:hypothetical protein [Steroidobacteraceae bacterium]